MDLFNSLVVAGMKRDDIVALLMGMLVALVWLILAGVIKIGD